MFNILLIEDDLDFADILVEFLQGDPEVNILEFVTNEADARDHLSSGVLHNVQAVLIDLHLARSGTDKQINDDAGLELIKEIRDVHKFNGTVIVMTSSDNPVDGQRAFRAGCDGYLCKSMRMNDLPSLIAELRMAIRGKVVMLPKEMKHIVLSGKASGA